MKRSLGLGICAVFVLLASCCAPDDDAALGETVRAVLFYSPTCPHCHQVMSEVLPPLQKKYGSQLQIMQVDVSTEDGNKLYKDSVTQFGITQDRLGVPTLIVGDFVLVGGGEIPEYFPGLIEQGLSSGGIDWPAIPGLVPPSS
jgi:hypothetical protein